MTRSTNQSYYLVHSEAFNGVLMSGEVYRELVLAMDKQDQLSHRKVKLDYKEYLRLQSEGITTLMGVE